MLGFGLETRRSRRQELFKTMTNLRKQIGRLEHLKQAVLTSIQEGI